MVVVRLVVLVPVVTRLDTVEVARFSGAELVVPPVRLPKRDKAEVRPRGEGGTGGTQRAKYEITRWSGTYSSH